MANSNARSSMNLVDEFEEAFQNCIHSLTKDEPTTSEDASEVKQEVDHATLQFIDLARQMECFFLQKRFILANMRPDLLMKDQITDLKIEIQRKDDAIKRHFEKIDQWKALLNDQPTPGSIPKMMPGQEQRPMGTLPMLPPVNHMGLPAGSSPLHGGPPGPSNVPHGGMMQMPPQPNPQQQMYMQQAGMRPNFPQGPLAYLEKTTNNIDMVGLGDVRR